jgi:hypothetical protein
MATLRQRQSGKWSWSDARGSSLNKVDAERWARQPESEIDKGIFVDRAQAGHSTLGELIDRSLKEVTPLKRSDRNDTRRLRLLGLTPRQESLLDSHFLVR